MTAESNHRRRSAYQRGRPSFRLERTRVYQPTPDDERIMQGIRSEMQDRWGRMEGAANEAEKQRLLAQYEGLQEGLTRYQRARQLKVDGSRFG